MAAYQKILHFSGFFVILLVVLSVREDEQGKETIFGKTTSLRIFECKI